MGTGIKVTMFIIIVIFLATHVNFVRKPFFRLDRLRQSVQPKIQPRNSENSSALPSSRTVSAERTIVRIFIRDSEKILETTRRRTRIATAFCLSLAREPLLASPSFLVLVPPLSAPRNASIPVPLPLIKKKTHAYSHVRRRALVEVSHCFTYEERPFLRRSYE